MQLHQVDSSMMSAIGYDEASSTLVIVFQSGKTYEYAQVPAQVFAEFLETDSKGHFFRSVIDDEYEYSLRRSGGRGC